MAIRLLAIFCLLYSASIWGDPIQPFHWQYDITFKTGKRTYNGKGYYRVDLADDKSTFTLGLQSNNKILSSREWVVFRPHAEYVAVPLYREQRTRFLGIPIKRKTELHPPAEGPYYDAMTVVLRILHDIQHQAADQWSFYHADEQKNHSFKIAGEETIQLPIGSVDCYVVRQDDPDARGSLQMWVAKQGNYIAAMENKEEKEVLRIEIINATAGG